jgi:GNAT superfamily N-acetyltransferase
MSIEKFIIGKTIKTDLVEGERLDDYLEDKDLMFSESRLVSNNRDFILAKDNHKIIGFAILFRSENGMTPLENVISLSNIEIHEDYKRKGIATRLFQDVMKHVKLENKILKRSQPTDDGQNYIEKKFSNLLQENKIPYIPYNLAFLYERLSENDFLKNKNNQEKISTLHQFEKKVLEHPTLKKLDIKSINMNFLKEADEIIQSQKPQNRLKNKLK